MKTLKLTICLLAVVAVSAMAQTYSQKGVVRMITTSASSPLTPVAGVKVTVGNNVSKATGSNGRFSLQVTRQFQVNGVTPGDEYVLALPTKGKAYKQSDNDLDVVVTTKTKKEADYKRLYNKLKAKYDEQTDELMALKRKYQRQLNEMKETDAEYAKTKAEYERVQALYLDCLNNEQKLDEEIKKIAEDLAITDYISLDSIEQQIYEHKTQGEYESINKMLQRVVWHGDRSAAFKKQDDIIAQKELELKEEKLNRETMLRLLLDDIESFKMRHLNDSVSECYKILTDAAPDNWEYLILAGRFETEYMANYSKAMDYFQLAVATNPADTLLATSYNCIGLVYASQGEYNKALEYFEKALKIRLSVFGENHPDVAKSYNNIGLVYDSQGDYTKALEYYEKDVKISLAVLGENHPDIATSYGNIGGVYNSQGDYTKALEYHEKALKIQMDILEENHPDVATSYDNIGLVYSSQGDYAKALEYYEKALKILLSVFGENHPYVATCYNNIGLVYYSQGEYDKALEFHEKALRINLAVLGESHPDVALSYNNIGLVYYSQGEYDKALEFFEMALKIMWATIGENHPDVARSYNNIGYVYKSQGDYDKALEYYEKALKILATFLPEDHPNIKKVKGNINYIKTKMQQQ